MLNPWTGIAQLSKSETCELQNQKLSRFITRYLYPFSPHYRSLFDKNKIDPRSIRTVDDLRRIPFTSKLDFIQPDNPQRFRDFILQPDQEKIRGAWPLQDLLRLKAMSMINGKEFVRDRLEREFHPCFITFTTGTTNRPVPYVYSGHDIRNLHLSGSRMLDLFNIPRSQNIVNMFPYAPHLAFWQVVFGGLSSCALVLSTGGGKVLGTEGQIGVLEKMRPAVVLGVPSYVYHVLRMAQEKGIRMEYVKKIVLGASRVSMAFKLKLAELLTSMGAQEVSVFGTYGFTEARSAWAECPTVNDISSGYHLYSDKEIFEVIDPKTGEPVGEGGDGEIVYTSIDSRGSSVLRYRTGDFVKGGIGYGACPHCGRTVPRLSSDITRLSDVKDLRMSKVKGTLIDLNHFSQILTDFPEIDEWQVEIRKKNNDPFEIDELVVYIACREGVNRGILEEAVKRSLSSMEVTPNAVVFLPLAEMIKRLELETANKEKRILDVRPKD
ncbi:MAG: AMP-binding protein [Candidatus Omnitrophota bacterium]|nr:AMP-binding protein [Candidatus Omnitrophota bacterium]MDZ4243075.1 AMP-binding protein [Candidatus Omnitrophota bacterium]